MICVYMVLGRMNVEVERLKLLGIEECRVYVYYSIYIVFLVVFVSVITMFGCPLMYETSLVRELQYM